MMRLAGSSILFFLLLSPVKLLAGESDRCLVVSVRDQKIAVVENGWTLATFPVSTSRYGVGDNFNSYATPLGRMEVAGKIGDGAPLGAVFRHRQWTGEVLRPNAAGRDPIVTRILWLRGLEYGNANAFNRNIYIHGTPVESLIGRPASYGCIRMRSRDVVELFDMTPLGSTVQVSQEHLRDAIASVNRQPHFGFGNDERIASNYQAW
jgi:lipoprotein-anchoring transpeptidase ErfK/SrfK